MISILATLAIITPAHSPATLQPMPVGARPPKGAVILFDGKSSSEWVHRESGKPCEWFVRDGNLEVRTSSSDILTKQEFGSYRLHIEFWLPKMLAEKDQGRANSGVYNHGRYEIQILDSFQNPTYKYGGCGAIYDQKDPDADAIKPPETWNTYDILFKAPKLDREGKVIEKPRITVWHNGIKIHDDVEIQKEVTTAGLSGPQLAKGPILLQNHGAPVRFRNIWLIPLDK